MLQLQLLIKRGETSLPDPEIQLKPGPLIRHEIPFVILSIKKPVRSTGREKTRNDSFIKQLS